MSDVGIEFIDIHPFYKLFMLNDITRYALHIYDKAGEIELEKRAVGQEINMFFHDENKSGLKPKSSKRKQAKMPKRKQE